MKAYLIPNVTVTLSKETKICSTLHYLPEKILAVMKYARGKNSGGFEPYLICSIFQDIVEVTCMLRIKQGFEFDTATAESLVLQNFSLAK